METTVKTTKKNNTRIILMDEKIPSLKRNLSDCDVSMALGLVQYELIHHTKG